MYDCSKSLEQFHDEKVTLSTAEQAAMRERRNLNRKRLLEGLAELEFPPPEKFMGQGSYAMWTMVQRAKNNYDIDDGVYFPASSLVGPNGGELTALATRKLICDAITRKADGFKQPPEVKTNCVRVHYAQGYHVDIPVYRTSIIQTHSGNVLRRDEIASSTWRISRPHAVTKWFNDENKQQSPDGDQLRRIVRYLKFFATSRSSWASRTVTGFMISALVVECYKPNVERDDIALHETMRAISDRLEWRDEILHPKMNDERLTKPDGDGRTGFFRSCLEDALKKLETLSHRTCDEVSAHKAWDTVFNTDFFAARCRSAVSAQGLIANGRDTTNPRPVDKRGGGHYG